MTREPKTMWQEGLVRPAARLVVVVNSRGFQRSKMAPQTPAPTGLCRNRATLNATAMLATAAQSLIRPRQP